MRGNEDAAVAAVRFYHGESARIGAILDSYEGEKKLAVMT